MSEEPEEREAEQEAQRAASAGDPIGMLRALGRSGFPEKLAAQIENQFWRFDREDARWAVAEAIDSLYAHLERGERKRNIFPYLLKAAQNKAKDLNGELARRVSFDEETDGIPEVPEPMTDEEREAAEEAADARRRAMYAEVKSLIPRIPQSRPRQIISIIVDAMEKGVQDLTNEEIGDMLGLTKGTVATAKSRGLDYLVELAKEENLVRFDFTARDLELPDEAEAIAAAEEEGDS
jgi:DNA-directed RNA polymerase specialized sigma24 family protein